MSVHTEGAQALIEELRALRQKVPYLVVSTFKGQRRKLAAGAAVPADFVERMVSAIESHAQLVRTGALDPGQLRDLMSYVEAFGPVADEVEALANVMRLSVTAARNKVGHETLTAYALAQRLADRPEHADLVPHVAAMRRALGKARKAKVKTAEPVPDAPQPPSTSPDPPLTTTSKP
jgi:hypothetical protein